MMDKATRATFMEGTFQYLKMMTEMALHREIAIERAKEEASSRYQLLIAGLGMARDSINLQQLSIALVFLTATVEDVDVRIEQERDHPAALLVFFDQLREGVIT